MKEFLDQLWWVFKPMWYALVWVSVPLLALFVIYSLIG
jgi:hypothetical protein